jgi:hypothetical protein
MRYDNLKLITYNLQLNSISDTFSTINLAFRQHLQADNLHSGRVPNDALHF